MAAVSPAVVEFNGYTATVTIAIKDLKKPVASAKKIGVVFTKGTSADWYTSTDGRSPPSTGFEELPADVHKAAERAAVTWQELPPSLRSASTLMVLYAKAGFDCIMSLKEGENGKVVML